MFFMFFILALTSFFVIRANLDNMRTESSLEWFVYKYENPDYYNYVAGIISNEENGSFFKEFPINFEEVSLSNGYVLNRGNFHRRTIRNDWGLSNILKVDLNVTMGFPDCLRFLGERFPNCFGHNADIRRGVNQVCDDLRNREQNPRTTLCEVLDEEPQLLTQDVFSEFYVCNRIPEDLIFEEDDEMIFIIGDLLNAGSLFNYCRRII